MTPMCGIQKSKALLRGLVLRQGRQSHQRQLRTFTVCILHFGQQILQRNGLNAPRVRGVAGATWLLPSAPSCRRLEMPPVPPVPPVPCSALMRGPGRQRLTPRWRLAAVRDANILPSTLTPLTPLTPQSFTIYSFHFISIYLYAFLRTATCKSTCHNNTSFTSLTSLS